MNKRICAWCNKVLEEGKEPITHGICDKCAEKLKSDLQLIKYFGAHDCGCNREWTEDVIERSNK